MADSSETGLSSLGEAVQETLDNVVHQIVDYGPQVIGALLVLLVGWLIAKMLALSAHKLVRSLDSLFSRYLLPEDSQRDRIKMSWANVISKTIFWVVLIFFLAVASNILGWDLFSGWMQRAFGYIPGIITGILIIIGGLILGNFTRSAVMSAGGKQEPTQRVFIAKLVQAGIISSAFIIGVDQIGLNINFLSNIVVTVIGILLAGAALAFGLGAKDLVANVIGARYLQRHCETGDIVTIGGIEGEVIEISQASVVIRTSDSKAVVPASHFHREMTLIKSHRE